MNSFSLARRFLRWRAVTTWLLVLSTALAVIMVVTLRSFPRALGAGAVEPATRFPVLIGRGESASRLVLSTVFLEPPAAPALPRVALDKARSVPGVAETLPLLVEYDGNRPVVSTTRAYFRLAKGRLRLVNGRFFQDEELGTAVVGNRVAVEERIAPGDTLLHSGGGSRVVGVLAGTDTALDLAVLTPLPPDGGPLSAIVVVPEEGLVLGDLERDLRDLDVMAVDVESTLRRLLRQVAAIERVVGWLSWGIAAMAAALILSSLYSGARERSRDLAVLRVLGARRWTILTVILWEATIIGAVGGLAGLLGADAILSAVTSVFSSGGLAFVPEVGADGFRVAAAGALLAMVAGLGVGVSVYRMDPALTLEGVHRPWPEVLGPKGRRRIRRGLLVLTLAALLLPSSTYVPSPRSREIDPASVRIFGLLSRWDGGGLPPSEMAALQGKIVELEGYAYDPIEHGALRGWGRAFFLVLHDPNRPVELFHGDGGHEPASNERIWVELVEPIESTRYPIHVTGRFAIEPGRTPAGDVLYRLARAQARVIALEMD